MIEDARDEKLMGLLWQFANDQRTSKERDIHDNKVLWDDETVAFRTAGFAKVMQDAGEHGTQKSALGWLRGMGAVERNERFYGKQIRVVRMSIANLTALSQQKYMPIPLGAPAGMEQAYREALLKTIETKVQHLPRRVRLHTWEVVRGSDDLSGEWAIQKDGVRNVPTYYGARSDTFGKKKNRHGG